MLGLWGFDRYLHRVASPSPLAPRAVGSLEELNLLHGLSNDPPPASMAGDGGTGKKTSLFTPRGWGLGKFREILKIMEKADTINSHPTRTILLVTR